MRKFEWIFLLSTVDHSATREDAEVKHVLRVFLVGVNVLVN